MAIILRPASDYDVGKTSAGGSLTYDPASPATFYDKVADEVPDGELTCIRYAGESSSNPLAGRTIFTVTEPTGNPASIIHAAMYLRGGVMNSHGPEDMRVNGAAPVNPTSTSPAGAVGYTKEYYAEYPTNPLTGNAWQWAELADIVFGCVYSVPSSKSGWITQMYLEVETAVPKINIFGRPVSKIFGVTPGKIFGK